MLCIYIYTSNTYIIPNLWFFIHVSSIFHKMFTTMYSSVSPSTVVAPIPSHTGAQWHAVKHEDLAEIREKHEAVETSSNDKGTG